MILKKNLITYCMQIPVNNYKKNGIRLKQNILKYLKINIKNLSRIKMSRKINLKYNRKILIRIQIQIKFL